jgi:hypothetical protein
MTLTEDDTSEGRAMALAEPMDVDEEADEEERYCNWSYQQYERSFAQ